MTPHRFGPECGNLINKPAHFLRSIGLCLLFRLHCHSRQASHRSTCVWLDHPYKEVNYETDCFTNAALAAG